MKTRPAPTHPWVSQTFTPTCRRNLAEREQAIKAAQERAKQFKALKRADAKDKRDGFYGD